MLVVNGTHGHCAGVVPGTVTVTNSVVGSVLPSQQGTKATVGDAEEEDRDALGLAGLVGDTGGHGWHGPLFGYGTG